MLSRSALIIAVATLTMTICFLVVAEKPDGKYTAEFLKAWELHQKGKPEAKASFERLLADNKQTKADRFGAAYVLAVISLAQKQPAKAIELLDRAEQLIPNRPEVTVRRAEALIATEEYKAAAKCLKGAKKALRSRKKTELYYRYQVISARLEHVADDTQRAAARLEKLVKRFPKKWETHFTLGTYYEKLDDPKRALAHYDRAIELDPKTDPHPGVYALQRWAAVAISSDPGSYGNKKTVKNAIERYGEFIDRAKANNVPPDLVQKVRQAKSVLESYGAK